MEAKVGHGTLWSQKQLSLMYPSFGPPWVSCVDNKEDNHPSCAGQVSDNLTLMVTETDSTNRWDGYKVGGSMNPFIPAQREKVVSEGSPKITCLVSG
ncbi:hypothetical protein NQZ68_021017, partial [Dissostichus eleginoides]